MRALLCPPGPHVGCASPPGSGRDEAALNQDELFGVTCGQKERRLQSLQLSRAVSRHRSARRGRPVSQLPSACMCPRPATLSGGAAGFGPYQGGELGCSGEQSGATSVFLGQWAGKSGHMASTGSWTSVCAVSAAQRPEQTVGGATGQGGVLCPKPACQSQKQGRSVHGVL